MGRQLTVSRQAEGAVIDVMVWLLEPEARLLETRTFASLAELTSWLQDIPDLTVNWTDELKADAGLAMALAEALGNAPADASLPSVHGGAPLFPITGARPEGETARPAFVEPPVAGAGRNRGKGRPRGRRNRGSSGGA